jgi:phosphoribosyl 1,2-cyclic phosphodiesterase
MRIKFWGVRGSTPTPEQRNARYGGNTPCIEVRLANNTLLVLDCGSGMRPLGKSLLREFGDRPISGYVFLTHFHWDHIQGIPFFLPLYRKGNTFLFHSVKRKGSELQATIEGQMTNPYFPVDMEAMGSTRHFLNLEERPININGAIIRSAPLNHPQGCVAYRIEADGAVFVLATDTEPGSREHDLSVREIARDADLLVYDSQYTPEQLRRDKKGWGHSCWQEGVRIARECGVKALALFHHDPDGDDIFLDSLVEGARSEFSNAFGSQEGLELELPMPSQGGSAKDIPARNEHRYVLEVPIKVRWVDKKGKQIITEGKARNVSHSGVYFVVHEDVCSDGPVDLDIVLPDEITHKGDMAFRFLAEPIRKLDAPQTEGAGTLSMGIAARILKAHDNKPAEPVRKGAKPAKRPRAVRAK